MKHVGMRRRSKFLLAITIAVLMLLSPMLGSWLVERAFEPSGDSDDTDGDGLSDSRESRYGTSSDRADTDGDGLLDGEEVDYWLDRALERDPPEWLTAFHGLETEDGARALLNPDRDLDLDGLANVLDRDADGDGLTDGEELVLNTDPADRDTDGDGVHDDLDDMPTYNGDVDGDGLPDDWELHYDVHDPDGDADLDGVTNIEEYKGATSPVLAFGTFGAGAFDLSALYAGEPLDSMGDLYGLFAMPDGTIDMERPLFQVDPTTPARYWRLFDLKTLSDEGWSRTLAGTATELSERYPDGLADDVSYSYDVQFNGRWSGPIPAPLFSTAVVGLSQGTEVTHTPDGVFSVTEGYATRYSVTTVGLSGLGDGSLAQGEYLWLSPTLYSLPPDLTALLDNDNEWVRVLKARDWLWHNVSFDPGRDQWHMDMPVPLTSAGKGTALDMASSLTIICRLLDVPARVAIGFAPGIISGEHRIVRVGDLHAWTEVFIGGRWLSAETTWTWERTSGLGLGVAGSDPYVLNGDQYGELYPMWFPNQSPFAVGHWGAQAGALSGGSGAFPVPTGPVDTDGDGTPDSADDDDDGDGLLDVWEYENGTNPIDPDTDHDGLNDLADILNGTSPTNGDSDGDGIADGTEVITLGTDPLNRDTDGAGSCDIQELEHGTDPLNPDDDEYALDGDCDGLTDDEERALGTDPDSWDSDLDGLIDPLEVDLGTDPLDEDTDDDGVADGEELDRGTDPLDEDTDDDGIPDGQERWSPAHNLVRSLPYLYDTDGDGLSDGEEIVLGTRPDSVDFDGDGLSDGEEVDLGYSPLLEDTDGDGMSDLEEAQRRDMEDRVETARDGALPIFIILTILSAAMAFRYRPFDRRIIPDVVDSLSELEKWLAGLKDRPDDEVRKAIYKAYERLCNVLSEYGYIRRRASTVREFEKGARDALPWVPDELIDELTTLFEEARYSDHDLDPDYVDRARACLAGIRESLEEAMGKGPEASAAEA